MTIPANIDLVGMISDLNKWGIGDKKIEAICGFSQGYVTHMKAGRWRDMTYQRAARLYNFWWDECRLHGLIVSVHAPVENSHPLAATT